jgi:D-alanyl-D-alanine carboxypeptidase
MGVDDTMKRADWNALWSDLGIPEGLVSACKLTLHEDATDLVSAGMDVFDREQFVTSNTLRCWLAMKSAAESDDISLSIVSAFRSVEYQCELIRNKLLKNQVVEEILKVNAMPGFSEHHSGRAIDIATVDCEPLSESFDETAAFQWLTENASRFDFVMSYPKDNPYNIIYEPWHWICQQTD